MSPALKVLKHKPADVVDACWINGQRTTDAVASAPGGISRWGVQLVSCPGTPASRMT
jgi:hypothetical protein